jgi:membrane protein implicated in regulation of membrane protease activity
MSVRQVQVRGCLPTLIALVVIGAVLAALVTASVAFLAVAVGAGLLAAGVRWARRLGGPPERKTPAARRAADVTIEAEVVEPPEGGEDRPPKRLE